MLKFANKPVDISNKCLGMAGFLMRIMACVKKESTNNQNNN